MPREARVLFEKHLQREQKRLELKQNLLTRLRTVFPYKKVILLQHAEMEFKLELMRKAHEL